MNIKQTLKEYKCAVFSIGCAVSIPLIIFLAALTGDRCQAPEKGSEVLDRCGHFFTNWIYDFQTLIAGILALLGACITVYMMHKNTLEIANSEWRTIVNNVISSARHLEAVLEQVMDEQKDFPKTSHNANWRDYCERFNTLIMHTKHIKYILQAADEVGLSFYSNCFIRQNIDTLNELLIRLEEEYATLTKNADAINVLAPNAIWVARFYFSRVVDVRDQTLTAFKLFIKNQHKHNPRNLSIFIDN